MLAGNALGHRYIAGQYPEAGQSHTNTPVGKDIGVNDIMLVTSRVRFSF
jgi:hypothetical protein